MLGHMLEMLRSHCRSQGHLGQRLVVGRMVYKNGLTTILAELVKWSGGFYYRPYC